MTKSPPLAWGPNWSTCRQPPELAQTYVLDKPEWRWLRVETVLIVWSGWHIGILSDIGNSFPIVHTLAKVFPITNQLRSHGIFTSRWRSMDPIGDHLFPYTTLQRPHREYCHLIFERFRATANLSDTSVQDNRVASGPRTSYTIKYQ